MQTFGSNLVTESGVDISRAPVASQVLAEEGASASTANEAAVRGDRSADTDEELIPFSELVKRLNSTETDRELE